jgi:meso-butanediol dehydrogenase/(S,S)-butanediol dehydrogenase/diacetyl reductase
MKRFEGKTAIITGAASGIGKATAQRLAMEGARVVCGDVQAAALEGVIGEIKSQGGTATACHCDVSDPESVISIITTAVDVYGQLDVLCNVAGILETAHTHEYPLDRWERLIKVNLTGTFLMCRDSIPHLLKTKGNIVNVASLAALRGHPYLTAYAASKGGVVGLTMAMAIEYAQAGLRINAVCPASIETPMTTEFEVPDGACFEILLRNMPPDNVMRGPETVAGVIAFLASSDAAHVNGIALRVDGGVMS